MRLVAYGFLVLLVVLPSLLILFASHRGVKARIPMAIAAFASPFVMIGLVNMVPALWNNTPQAPQWLHMLGIVLWGSGFFLPWVIFALFLHMKAPVRTTKP
ncbi:hypothetical protein MCEMSEM23_01011 [Rhabdaerophilaceae bacterium]